MMLVACLLAISAGGGLDQPVRLTNPRYELEWHGSRVEAEEALRVLDAAYSELSRFFAAHPKDPLRVRVFRDEKSRIEGAWNDGATVPAQSKYASFSEVTRTAYVAKLEGVQATRSALLYGACMQFHSLANSKNIDVGRTWQGAGIALDFSRSTWNGRSLDPFAMPRVEPVDLPGKALRALSTIDAELPGQDGVQALDPALTWGVVAMCLHGHKTAYREAFKRYALGETGSKIATQDFLRSLGAPRKVIADLGEFLGKVQTPFEATGDWEDRGTSGLLGHGESTTFSYCVLREGVGHLGARMSALPKGTGRAGFVAGWYGPDDYARIDIEAPNIIVQVQRLGHTVETMRLALAGDASREHRIELDRAGSQYVLTVDGTKIAELELPSGRMGFFVNAADVSFRDVAWR